MPVPIQLTSLPNELISHILYQCLVSAQHGISTLIKLARLNKLCRSLVLKHPKSLRILKMPRPKQSSIPHLKDDRPFISWILNPISDSLTISNRVQTLDLSHCPLVRPDTVIFILYECIHLRHLSLFKAPFVRLSCLRSEIARFFKTRPRSVGKLPLSSLDLDFCGSSDSAEVYDRGNTRHRDDFYDICHLEALLMSVCKVGSEFKMNPRPCPDCRLQIARTQNVCIRCEAAERKRMLNLH